MYWLHGSTFRQDVGEPWRTQIVATNIAVPMILCHTVHGTDDTQHHHPTPKAH
ncbi:hypothetical protein E2C01_077226 [Portunus trituberculatus]|uniref:Uncharacterized protein n=1 Tax=Portunus trituberculatus TaxID=210409 RepID=A0A5B7IJS8_PORTR|nr:hypothetical protein [Portunus trituberculatus]